jgi:putative hydrolase of HD superfamily
LILAWVFGSGTRLNIKRLLKLALVHSLSAVDIGYISPYGKLLQIKDKKELQKKYPALVLRAPVAAKGEIAEKRFEEEKKAVERLTENLPEAISHEIRYLWLEFQQKTSKEAKFLKALDRLENLIQALEYKDQIKKELLSPFISQIGLVTDNKRILDFARSAIQYFTKGEKSVKSRKDRNLIKFFIEVGKLKTVLRKGWLIRGVKNPESLAAHSFRSAIIAWLFSAKRRINQEVVIVMAIMHDLFTSAVGDITPYDGSIKNLNEKEGRRLVESLPWLGSKAQKELLARERLGREAAAFDKILKFLPDNLRHEIKYYWLEYKTGASREGRFFRQVDRIEALLPALEYQTKDKNIPITSFWLQLKELLDDPVLMDFVSSVDRYYFKRGSKLH